MRDYAKVAPRFWTGNTGRAMRGKPNQQVLMLYLITCPNANMLGLYYLPLPTIAHETGMSEIEVKAALAWLNEQSAAHYDHAQELVWIPEMATYQIGSELKVTTPGKGDKRIFGILNDLKTFRGHPFAIDFIRKYNEPFNLGVGRSTNDMFIAAGGRGAYLPEDGISPLEDPSEGHCEEFEAPSKPGSGSGSGSGAGAGGEGSPPSGLATNQPIPDFNAPRTSHGLLVLFGKLWGDAKGREWYGRPRAARAATEFMDRPAPEIDKLAPLIRPAIDRYLANTKPFYIEREHSFDVFVKDFDALVTARASPPHPNGRPKPKELRVVR